MNSGHLRWDELWTLGEADVLTVLSLFNYIFFSFPYRVYDRDIVFRSGGSLARVTYLAHHLLINVFSCPSL